MVPGKRIAMNIHGKFISLREIPMKIYESTVLCHDIVWVFMKLITLESELFIIFLNFNSNFIKILLTVSWQFLKIFTNSDKIFIKKCGKINTSWKFQWINSIQWNFNAKQNVENNEMFESEGKFCDQLWKFTEIYRLL